jgi:biotin carboxyl carrier protein
MSETKILSEVAGRICAVPATVGDNVGDGDDIVLIEAMKMEIPVAATVAGKIKSILVKFDDTVAEGQLIAIIET